MATRYHKRYHILPGVRINMSRPMRPSSLTLGHPRLCSMTLGDDHHWFNINLPGGYSWRSSKRGGDDQQKSRQRGSDKHGSDKPGSDKHDNPGAETHRHSAKAAILGFGVGALSFGTPLGATLLHFAFH
jgi:hypothetical protein